MSKLLEDSVVAVRRLSPVVQDEIAAIMIDMADMADPAWVGEATDADDAAAVEDGLAQIRRGEYASDEEVEAAFRRFGA